MAVSLLPISKWVDDRISSVHVKSSVMGLVLRAASILASIVHRSSSSSCERPRIFLRQRFVEPTIIFQNPHHPAARIARNFLVMLRSTQKSYVPVLLLSTLVSSISSVFAAMNVCALSEYVVYGIPWRLVKLCSAIRNFSVDVSVQISRRRARLVVHLNRTIYDFMIVLLDLM